MKHQLCIALLIVLVSCARAGYVNKNDYMNNAYKQYAYIQSDTSPINQVFGNGTRSELKPPGYAMHLNKDCPGHNLEKTSVANAAECAEMCDGLEDCVGFQFNLQKMCYLKYECAVLNNNNEGTIYISEHPVGYERYPRTDCAGNDIQETTAQNAFECAKKCDALENCVAFVFTTQKFCYPKSLCYNVKSNGLGTIYKNDNPAGYSWHPGKDCAGNDLKITTAASAVECGYICNAFENCVAFLYTKPHCYPKHTCTQLTTRGTGATYMSEQPPNPDDLLRVHNYQLGSSEDAIDGTGIRFWGYDAMTMIQFIRIVYYESSGVKYVRCVGFGYADKTCNCPERPPVSTYKVQDYPLDREEYITEVRADYFLHVGSIYFQTSKNKAIGPYGTETDPNNLKWRASHEGAPLLYVDGFQGMWVYRLDFYFYDKGVLNLEGVTNEVANKTYISVKGKIADIFEINHDYQRMLPDVARKGCYLFEHDQNPKAQISCDLQALLDQVNVLATASRALKEHSRRDLLDLKDFDSSKYLEQVKDAKTFHNMITEIKFDLQTVIDVTDQQSADLNRYFSSVAEMDIKIAEQDQIYITGAIKERMTAADDTVAKINQRFNQILGVGVSIATTQVVDKAFQLGTIIAANMNPFKWIFGGPDFDTIYEAVEELSAAVKDLVVLSTLLGRLDEFVSHSRNVVAKLQENMEQITGMEELIKVLATETDPDVIAGHAEKYVELYGSYTPQVKEKDIVFATTLLSAIASEACSIIGDFTGLIGDIIGSIYEPVTFDCQFIEADIAVLASVFTDVYTLQFELIDSLTSIVKGSVAKSNAGRIGAIKKTIDLRTAAIGTAIVETKYQAASMARCDVLEYIQGGKRPKICEYLLFRDSEIEKLIAYTGSAHKSDWFSYALLPIGYDNDDINIPFINITNLLIGEYQSIQLPSKNKEWLQTYGWLPSVYDQESAFYYLTMELFVPGIKCMEADETVHTVNVKSVSVYPTDLYSEDAPPIYNADKQMTVFEYSEPATGTCPGYTQRFPVHDSATLKKRHEVEVCVKSAGDIAPDKVKDDFTYPSVFNTWTIKVIGAKGCTLVVDDSLDFKPMVTARLKMRQVFVKKSPGDQGIENCWPSGSRCEADEFCVSEGLTYRCQKSSKAQNEQAMESDMYKEYY